MHRPGSSAAFTLVEVAVAGALLVVLVAALAVSMTQINRWATAAGLHTLALALTQQRIDEVLTTGWNLRTGPPPILTPGLVTETGLSLNSDAFNTQSGLGSSFTSLSSAVSATRRTQITFLSARTVRAAVTVSFVFRGRTYTTNLTTLRASDDI